MCRKTTSGSNKAVSPPLRTPCAPVPRSHCTLASKCKHFRFAVDEPCCPHHIKKRATLYVVLFLCVGKQHRARIRRFLRLCALRAPLCPGHTARSLRNASISASLLTSPVVPTNKKAHQDDVLFLLYGTIYGREPNRTVGVRRLLANACVMHRV